ncbi:MAG: hypothetical protein B6D61_05145 [Bacteroidetes bacterium 4484_249]|nr:MAG: hypothetical protein B6D61_05145 [Bacteroidetes bacterium 4484_249]
MSKNFSHTERRIASFLSQFPGVKSYAKKYYQWANYLLSKKNYSFQTNRRVNKISLHGQESFFGYYDKFPEKNQWVLFHSYSENTNQKPNKNTPVIIAGYNIASNEYRQFDKSFAYNWQQGSRLQWLDDDRFIFNDVDKGQQKYISKIFNIQSSKVETIIDFPVYDTNNSFALSLNFKRLAALNSDYGYYTIQPQESDIENLKKDGIFYIGFNDQAVKLLLSFEDVIEIHKQQTMQQAQHKFNHIMISPDGKRFMFIHRWYKGGVKYDSLLVSDIDGNNLHCIADDGMVSHCFWKDNTTIFGYLRDIRFGNKYFLIDVLSGEKKVVGDDSIWRLGDGHPHIIGNDILFDTYPNKSRMQQLFLYNIENMNLEKVGEFYASMKFYENTRCDLHPRLSKDGSVIFIDSVHEGKRFLYRLTK